MNIFMNGYVYAIHRDICLIKYPKPVVDKQLPQCMHGGQNEHKTQVGLNVTSN